MPTTTSEEVKRPHTQMDGDEPVQKKPKHENEIVSLFKSWIFRSFIQILAPKTLWSPILTRFFSWSKSPKSPKYQRRKIFNRKNCQLEKLDKVDSKSLPSEVARPMGKRRQNPLRPLLPHLVSSCLENQFTRCKLSSSQTWSGHIYRPKLAIYKNKIVR